MKYQTILLQKFFGLNGAVCYEAIAIGLLLITDILLSILKGLP